MRNQLYLFFTFLFLIFGCRKPIPDPQASDFIYLSIKQELANSEAELATKTGQLNDLVSKIPEADVQKAEIKMLRAKIDLAKKDVRKIEQKIKYWKLKLLSREETVRVKYLEAFNKGQEWDSAPETQRFQKSIARLQKRNPANSKQAPSKPPPTEGHESPKE